MQNKHTNKKVVRQQNDDDNNDSYIKFLHNVFGAPNVDIYVNKSSKPIVSNLQYQQFTGYLNFSSNNLTFTVKVAGTNTVLVTQQVAPEDCKYYTAIVVGDVTNLKTIQVLVFDDENNRPKCHTAEVRFIHGCFGAPAVDVYVGTAKAFSNVKFGETGTPEYAPLPLDNATVGTCTYFYKFSVNVAGTTKTVVGPLPVNLSNRGRYTIVASGSPKEGDAITAVITQDNEKC